MTKTYLLLFWVVWLLDVFIFLYGYREFINGVFGRYAAPTSKYIGLWVALFIAALIIIIGSLLLKKSGHTSMAMTLVSIPLVLALPYGLWIASIIIFGKNNMWR